MPRRVEIDWNGFDRGVYRFSPDGWYITYSSTKGGNADICLLPISGGEPIRVTNDPARDYEPIWTADGKLLLFLSDRVSSRIDLWGVRMLDGKPAGDPFVVRPDVGNVRLSSLSNNGRLLHTRERAEFSIYVTAVDPATYQPIGKALKLGSRSQPTPPQATWSPDGKLIAYKDNSGGYTALRVMAADGTDDREIASVRPFIGPFAWASDNDHIYMLERRPETGVGIYTISVSTGERKPVLLDHEILGHVASSPDGKRLAFLRGLRHRQVYAADVDGKNLRQVTFVDEDTAVGYPAWSPDAKQIAWFSSLSAKETSSGDSLAREIRTAAVSGGHAYQPFPVDLGGSVRTSTAEPRWSPDGKKMLFAAGHYVHQILLMDNFLREADTKAEPDGQGPSR